MKWPVVVGVLLLALALEALYKGYFSLSLFNAFLVLCGGAIAAVFLSASKSNKIESGQEKSYTYLNRQFAIMFAIRRFFRKLNTEAIRKRKQEYLSALNDKFKPIEGMSEGEKKELLSLSVGELLDMLKEGKLSSETLVKVYCERAILSGQRYNCVTDQCFIEAIESARKADEHIRTTKTLLGPLHGIPISIKDCFDMKGLDSTLGVGSRCFNPAVDDAVIIKLLKQAGAIPFVKTNVMQCLCGFESSNPVFGAVKNPWNTNRTPGGSSGGEAALVSSFGSPLGIGSDIGGSIRIPSHFCGLYGFKPTGRRMSKKGANAGLGQYSIIDSFGPIARTASDLTIVAKIFFSEEHHLLDNNVPPVPFNEDLYRQYVDRSLTNEKESKKKLRFGFYLDDGYFEPFSGCQRAVLVAKAALEDAGYEVVPFPIEEMDVKGSLMKNLFGLYTANHHENFVHALKDSEVDPAMRLQLVGSQAPGWAAKLTGKVLKNVLKEERISELIEASLPMPVYEYQQLQKKHIEDQEKMQDMMKSMRIDVLLTPAMATVAIPHLTQIKLTPIIANYTMLYNYLDFPAGVVPITYVTEQDIEKKRKRKRRSQVDKFMEEVETSSPAGTLGLPIGVQIVGLPWKDEMCLAAMEVLGELLPFKHLDPK